MAAKVKHVVVDSAGFIRDAPLRDIGDKLYTISEVVNEIRDKATRQRLQVLPYEIQFKHPSPESIKFVTDFSKKTGDYPSLSAVDLKLMGLAYQLEKENVGTEHIRTQPQSKATWFSTKKHLEKPTEIAGFYLSKKTTECDSSRTTSVCESQGDVESRLNDIHLDEDKVDGDQSTAADVGESDCKPESEAEMVHQTEVVVTDKEETSHDADAGESSDPECDRDTGPVCTEGGMIPEDCIHEGDDSEEDTDEEDEEEDEDEDGWITPGNVAEVKKSMGGVNCERADVSVGCLTTDFAMQNVLIQMGLNVISVDGMLIKHAKSYVLRCSACMKVTTAMTKEFCPHCGNKALTKVAITIGEDGKVNYFFSRRRNTTTRGMRYSLPMPKGGKHSANPILCEDQREAQQRASKASKVKYNVFEADYIAHNSPFAPIDTQSRAAQLGVRSHNHGFQKRRNPNENRKVYGRRK